MAHPHVKLYPPLLTPLDTLKLLGHISDTYDRPRTVFSGYELDAALRIGVITPHKPRISRSGQDVVGHVRTVPCYESLVASRNSCCGLNKQPGPSTSRMSQQNSSVEFPSSLVCASFEYTPIFDLTELLTSKSPLERLECITKHELKKSSKRRQQRPDGSATSMGHPRSVAPPARVSEHKPSVGLAKTDKPLPPLPPKHPVSTRHRPSKDCYKQVDSILAKARRKRDERTQGQLTQREPTKTDLPLVYRRNSDYELHHLCPLIPISRASCSPVDISPYHNDTSDSDVVELDSIVIGDTSSPCDNSAPQAGCNIPGCDKQLVEKIPSPSCSCSGRKEAEGGKRRSCCVAEPPPSPFYDGTVQGAGVVRRRSGRWSVTSKSFRRRWSGLC